MQYSASLHDADLVVTVNDRLTDRRVAFAGRRGVAEFIQFDLDGDGQLSEEERSAAGQARASVHPGGPQGENGFGGAKGKNGHGGAKGKNGFGGPKGKNGHGGAKGKNGQIQFLNTSHHAAYDAKNRHGLPAEIPMGDSGKEAFKNLVNEIKAARKDS
jgi:hypothetical protein